MYIPINWDTNNILDYVKQAKHEVSKNIAERKYFYGFSMGGMLALALCKEFKPEAIIISSVAPFFKEDLAELSWYYPKKLYNWYLFGNSETISANALISDINKLNTKLSILVGSEEESSMVNRSQLLASSLQNGKLTIMENVGHGISKPKHMDYIFEVIRENTENVVN